MKRETFNGLFKLRKDAPGNTLAGFTPVATVVSGALGFVVFALDLISGSSFLRAAVLYYVTSLSLLLFLIAAYVVVRRKDGKPKLRDPRSRMATRASETILPQPDIILKDRTRTTIWRSFVPEGRHRTGERIAVCSADFPSVVDLCEGLKDAGFETYLCSTPDMIVDEVAQNPTWTRFYADVGCFVNVGEFLGELELIYERKPAIRIVALATREEALAIANSPLRGPDAVKIKPVCAREILADCAPQTISG